MHIILVIISALAGLFWAFTHFTSAARQGKDAVDEVRGAFRRGKWSKKIDQRLIENLDDAREAAAIMLYQTAIHDGALTERQRQVLTAQMMQMFDNDQMTADELLAFARMALNEINDAANSLRKILNPVNAQCSDQEKHALLTAMQTVAAVEGSPNDQQSHLIAQTKRLILDL